jgi:hypothetical protein
VVDLSDLDVHELGERVKALDGDDVYDATLQRALAIATRNTVPASGEAEDVSPAVSVGPDLPARALTSDAVVAALRTEFLKRGSVGFARQFGRNRQRGHGVGGHGRRRPRRGAQADEATDEATSKSR